MRSASRNRIISALVADGATEMEASETIDVWIAAGGLIPWETANDFYYIPNDATDILAILGFQPHE